MFLTYTKYSIFFKVQSHRFNRLRRAIRREQRPLLYVVRVVHFCGTYEYYGNAVVQMLHPQRGQGTGGCDRTGL